MVLAGPPDPACQDTRDRETIWMNLDASDAPDAPTHCSQIVSATSILTEYVIKYGYRRAQNYRMLEEANETDFLGLLFRPKSSSFLVMLTATSTELHL